MEQLDEHTQFITECTALVHDIGIRPVEERFGDSNGKLQEQGGPAHARKMLIELCFDEKDISRICYLVDHHHTYSNDCRIFSCINLEIFRKAACILFSSVIDPYDPHKGSPKICFYKDLIINSVYIAILKLK